MKDPVSGNERFLEWALLATLIVAAARTLRDYQRSKGWINLIGSTMSHFAGGLFVVAMVAGRSDMDPLQACGWAIFGAWIGDRVFDFAEDLLVRKRLGPPA